MPGPQNQLGGGDWLAGDLYRLLKIHLLNAEFEINSSK